jgi:FkbH-like protein
MPGMSINRSNIEALISAGDWPRAADEVRAIWQGGNALATAPFVISCFERIRDVLPMTDYHIAILRSFTTEPIVPPLRAHAFSHSIDLQVQTGVFNGYAQELLRSDSVCYRPEIDAVILAVLTRDVAPELWGTIEHGSTDFTRVAQRVSNQFEAWVQQFRMRSSAQLIIHTLEKPAWLRDGLIDAQRACGQAEAIETINRHLRELAEANPGTFVLDYDALVARHGRLRWNDDSKWHTVRLPIAADHISDMAFEWIRFIVPLAGKIAKAVAVDLDNTLWGGILGEDGPEGIKLGVEYPGVIYQAIQRRLLDLNHRGILLVICSKNDHSEVMDILNGHPGMILRPEHFAAMRINWGDKPENLKDIASELNLALDSFAFVDDNPIERAEMRKFLPEVMTVELPQNPAGYADAIQTFPPFLRLRVSDEDRRRNAAYAARAKVASLSASATSPEEFLKSLGQRAEIQPLTPMNLARVAQLTQKTNQFNVTTRRYTEQQLGALHGSPDWEIAAIKVEDRFGDNGLVGVAITKDEQDWCVIDTLLLSCRVIGRGIETALMSHVCERARCRGKRLVKGIFIPSRKNAAASEVFRNHGFEPEPTQGEEKVWLLNLERKSIEWPEWIERKSETVAQQ